MTLPSGRLVSRIGDGDVPGPAEDDCKGHVPLLAAEREKEISYLGASISGCTPSHGEDTDGENIDQEDGRMVLLKKMGPRGGTS